jgi:hypothetical protein
MHFSALRSHIRAMGGELELITRFPDGAAQTSKLAELGQLGAKLWGRTSIN